MKYLIYMLGILVVVGGIRLLLYAGRSAVLILICLIATAATADTASSSLFRINEWIYYYYVIIGATTIVVSYRLLTKPSRTLLGRSWRILTIKERATVIVLFLLVFCSTVASMVSDRPAAGSAFIVFIAFIALTESWNSACRSKGDKIRTFQPLVLINTYMIIAGLLASWLGPRGGNNGKLLNSSGALAMFSAAVLGGALVFGGQRRLLRFIGVILGSMALFDLVIQHSDKSSIIVGVLLSWIVIAISSRLRLHSVNVHVKRQRVLPTIMAIIIILTCITPPVLTYVLYSGSLQSEKIAGFVSWIITKAGESELNLFDRPKRWSVLLVYITAHPINLLLTNFEDIVYEQLPGVWESAQPHNILIAFGVWWGWLGLVIVVLAIYFLFRRAAFCVLYTGKRDQVVALWSIGVTSSLFFRNMWSIGVLSFPLETFIFASAVCLIALLDTHKASSCTDSIVETSRIVV
jgi:hypothetical protein